MQNSSDNYNLKRFCENQTASLAVFKETLVSPSPRAHCAENQAQNLIVRVADPLRRTNVYP